MTTHGGRDEGGGRGFKIGGPETVTWQSVEWKDGSKYEGLIKEDKCHVRGVLRYANGDR